MDQAQLWQLLIAVGGALVGWLIRHKFGPAPLPTAPVAPAAPGISQAHGQMLDQLMTLLRQLLVQQAAQTNTAAPAQPGEMTLPIKVKVQASHDAVQPQP